MLTRDGVCSLPPPHPTYAQALEEVKLREMAIIDLQKRITEGEAKLKQQQNLYEAVRADRNLYSKNLIESQDEIQEMKRKFKIMQHQIEQLKEEISAKDLALVKEHFDHMKVCGRVMDQLDRGVVAVAGCGSRARRAAFLLLQWDRAGCALLHGADQCCWALLLPLPAPEPAWVVMALARSDQGGGTV
jgi:hypothetical protein